VHTSSIPRTMYDSFHGSLANRVCSFRRASSSVSGREGKREREREREYARKNYTFEIFWAFYVTSSIGSSILRQPRQSFKADLPMLLATELRLWPSNSTRIRSADLSIYILQVLYE
jgi:hypothetical protein